MDPQASGSRTYRTPTVNDGSDDEDDLDDLDDVLVGFNQPAPNTRPTPSSASPAPPRTASVPSSTANQAEGDDDDFEASLAGEMEQLLRQLAGTHIPGPMPDLPSGSGSAPPIPGTSANGNGEEKLSPEDEQAAFQKAIEMMLSPEGIAAMGLNADGSGASSSSPAPPPPSSGAKPTFDETIQRTMDSLGSKRTAGGIPGAGDLPPDLAAMLAKMGEEGFDGEGDDQFAGLLDGMMSQLMTKEVLEEPMSELASKYPEYLASPPEGVTPEQIEVYRKQHKIVEQIVATFRKPNYSADEDSADITKLVGEMQDLGGPPKEIVGDLPEGLDLGGGDEACVIM